MGPLPYLSTVVAMHSDIYKPPVRVSLAETVVLPERTDDQLLTTQTVDEFREDTRATSSQHLSLLDTPTIPDPNLSLPPVPVLSVTEAPGWPELHEDTSRSQDGVQNQSCDVHDHQVHGGQLQVIMIASYRSMS
jgi:hypothetical protein